MKRCFYFTLVFSIACSVISCSKSAKEERVNEEAQQAITRVFTCTFAQPDTKVSINDATGKTEWEAGDKIRIHGGASGTTSEVYTLKAGDISADGKTAQIAVTVAPYPRTDKGYTSNLYAAYPSDLVAADPMYYNTAFTTSNAPLMAAYNEGDTFVFYNLCGLITFSVTGDYDSYTLEGNAGETVGYSDYQVRLAGTSGDPVLEFARAGDGHTPSALKKISGTFSDGTNTIGLATGTNFSAGFTISLIKGGDIKKTFATGAEVNVARGKLLPLGNITSYLKDYVAPSSHDATHPAIAGAYDLGAAGTANSYLLDSNVDLAANKVYKFKAYQGNSTTDVGKISSVEVLWETYNDSNTPTANSVIAAVDFDKQVANDYEICFQMPATIHAGNAVIAAKNAGGTILWSWHIWVPSSDVSTVDVSSICGSKLMDRNLGALEPVSTAAGASVYSLGFYYEWGRKDPFMSPKRVENEAGHALVSGTAPTVQSSGTMTIAETIQNPTVYASKGISDMNLTKWAETKTIYDPCPPGYKMPYVEREDSNPFTKSDLATSLPTAGYGWASSTSGFWFKFNDGMNEVVFPLAGYVEENITSYYSYKNTIRAAVWYLCDSGSSPYHLNIRPSESTNAFGSTNLSRGCNVRCCLDE